MFGNTIASIANAALSLTLHKYTSIELVVEKTKPSELSFFNNSYIY